MTGAAHCPCDFRPLVAIADPAHRTFIEFLVRVISSPQTEMATHFIAEETLLQALIDQEHGRARGMIDDLIEMRKALTTQHAALVKLEGTAEAATFSGYLQDHARYEVALIANFARVHHLK